MRSLSQAPYIRTPLYSYEPCALPPEPLDALFEAKATRDGLDAFKARHPAAKPFTLLRFLKAREGDVEKASAMYAAHCEWVTSRPVALPEAGVKDRVCYAAKERDVDGNALVIYRGKVLHTYNITSRWYIIRCMLFKLCVAVVDVQLQYLLRSYTPFILFRDWYSTDVT